MYFSETEDYTYATSPSGYSNNSGFALTVLGPAVYMLQTENFGDLSDAMKIWTIDASDYFGCHFSRPAYGMLYNYSFGNYGSGGSSAMKKLYQNKAEGVCSTFTDYEYLLFSVLDIECYARSNYNINHAWTVVKVKNSAGKVLWIPFDYGIGPAENLAVSEEVYNKYLSTESARYKLYLSGIKGAPKKKNFTTEDFK